MAQVSQEASTADATNRPTRGYSRPPFEPGHTLTVKHGAESPRVIATKAAEIRPMIRSVAPWLDDPAFLPAVDRWLRAEARSLLLHEWITKVADEKGTGRVSIRLWEMAAATERLAARLGSDLGLDPAGRARLMATAAGAALNAATLADIREKGRETKAWIDAEVTE